jgi:hypothetical protein
MTPEERIATLMREKVDLLNILVDDMMNLLAEAGNLGIEVVFEDSLKNELLPELDSIEYLKLKIKRIIRKTPL